ncbi:hypothetical protein Tco_0873636 [Tanacetum coccineum]|uniref:Integrase, catalytic region, zinc finger, CCHC-type, peptidase aspartic, catalytic n=1 Tax=Tanacetum coccineum TaxID=301880 RepID=A0ABQ5BJG0_9ASTR
MLSTVIGQNGFGARRNGQMVSRPRKQLDGWVERQMDFLRSELQDWTLIWQQCIRLYCRGKKNGVNIMKSIDEGPFQMGTFRETLAEGTEDNERYNADIRATNILLQRLPKDIYSLINNYTNAKDIWDNVKMLLEGSELTKEDRESQMYDDFEHFRQNKGETIHDYYVPVFAPNIINECRNNQDDLSRMQLYCQVCEYMLLNGNVKGRQNRGQGNNARGRGAAGYGGAQNRVGNVNPGQARQIKCYNYNAQENGVALDEEQLLFIAGGHDNAIDEDMDEQPVQDLALNVDNVFQADDYDAFDSDVDEAPTT